MLIRSREREASFSGLKAMGGAVAKDKERAFKDHIEIDWPGFTPEQFEAYKKREVEMCKANMESVGRRAEYMLHSSETFKAAKEELERA